MKVGNKLLKLQLWDTAGQEKFRNITKSFYSSAKGIMLIYSVDSRESFEQVGYWMEQIKELAPKEVSVILIGNKSDIDKLPINNEMKIPHRCVSYEEGQSLAEKYEIKFFETSAKEDINVTEAFGTLSKGIVSQLRTSIPVDMNTSFRIKKKHPQPPPESKCFLSRIFS